jgi:hypothetical protein
MTEKEKVETIMIKYHRNATPSELKTVLNFVAEESNRKQRVLVGLEKEE